MTQRIYINDDWKFTQKFTQELLDNKYDDNSMESVRLPHTCKEIPLHYFDEHIYQMVSGYRKKIMIPEEWKSGHVILTIEGAAHDSEVFLNGEKVGTHHCGYTAFVVDLSEKLVYGEENILVVKVDSNESLNIPPFGHVVDYMTYGGIYRDVYLEIYGEIYISDIYVHTDIKDNKWADVISEISLNKKADNISVRQSIREEGTQEFIQLGKAHMQNEKMQLHYNAGDVKLWTPETPNLYELKTELIQDDTVIDEKTVVFGFRKAEFKTDGFYLNGQKYKIRGLNRHQSYPYAGYAMPESMQRLDAKILKTELGLNAVRTSHYPQSHYFLDECDRLGLLVFTEIPGWQHIGDEAWKNQAVDNVHDMIIQYRNHTSIILWGVRINESCDDDEFYTRTNEMAHKLDLYRQTGGVRANKKSSLLEDVYTYNDFVHAGNNKGCEHKNDVTSDKNKPYLVSEYNGHMYPTKAFDWEEHRREHAIRHANVLDAISGEEDIAGSFGWCMFDYNTHKDFGSGDRICYHGVLDMFRNHKLAALIYSCQQDDIPVLEISSSMDIGEHPGCNRGTTYIFSNADSVRMYKNNRFIKEYDKKDSPYKNLKHGPVIIDDFIGDAIEKNEDFKPGQAQAVKYILNSAARFGISNLPKAVYVKALKLMAVYHMKPFEAVGLYNKYVGDWGGKSTVYRFEAIKNGKVVKTIIKEPMHEITLGAQADHTKLSENNSYDVALVRINATDENGNTLSFCNDPVTLSVSGPIEVIGPKVVSLQGGLGGTYVKTLGQSGTAQLMISMANIKNITIDFIIE